MRQIFWWVGCASAFFLSCGCSESVDSEPKETAGNALTQTESDQTLRDTSDLNAAVSSNPAAKTESPASFFVVDHYDPQRNAVKDLEMTVELASKAGKRILIEVGGKW